MKLILFFSRFTLICNVAFLLFIILSKIEAKKPITHSPDTVQAVPFFKDIIITLGFSAVIINFFMCLFYAILVIIGRQILLPKWFAI